MTYEAQNGKQSCWDMVWGKQSVLIQDYQEKPNTLPLLFDFYSTKAISKIGKEDKSSMLLIKYILLQSSELHTRQWNKWWTYQYNTDKLLKVFCQVHDRRTEFQQPVDDLVILKLNKEEYFQNHKSSKITEIYSYLISIIYQE